MSISISILLLHADLILILWSLYVIVSPLVILKGFFPPNLQAENQDQVVHELGEIAILKVILATADETSVANYEPQRCEKGLITFFKVCRWRWVEGVKKSRLNRRLCKTINL